MHSLVKNGKTLLSGVDPVRRGKRTADAVSVKDKTLYFCPSPIYGYGLDCLLSKIKETAPSSAILCVEADSELYELSCREIEASVLKHEKLRLTNVCEAAGLSAIIDEIWGERAFRRIEIVRFSGGWQLFPELYASLAQALDGEIATKWSNVMTLTKLGRVFMRNALRNLSLPARFPSVLNLSFGGEAVLVLGSGPSLDETLNKIKTSFNNENRPFKIVCVDTSLGSLKERKIIPDLVVILESQHWNLRDFIGCKDWNVPFAMDFSALPQSANMLSQNGFLFMTPWTPLRLFERLKNSGLLPAVMPPLGSVGLTAVELARRLTNGKIFCAGLDFSFTQDKYHSRGTPGHRDILNRHNRFASLFNRTAYAEGTFAAVSKLGIPAHTNAIMKNYSDVFEREFGNDPRISFNVEELFVSSNRPQRRKDTFSAAQTNLRLPKREAILEFIKNEIARLEELRDILSGGLAADKNRLGILIDECDYLWAHFPDYAGKRRQKGDEFNSSFLNRVRVEIEPAINLLHNEAVTKLQFCNCP